MGTIFIMFAGTRTGINAAIKKQQCVGTDSASESLALAGDGVSLVPLAGETGGNSHSYWLAESLRWNQLLSILLTDLHSDYSVLARYILHKTMP